MDIFYIFLIYIPAFCNILILQMLQHRHTKNSCYTIFNFIFLNWKSKSETKAHWKSSQGYLKGISLERCSNCEENHRRRSNPISHQGIQIKTKTKCQVPLLHCCNWRLTRTTVSQRVSMENFRHRWQQRKSNLENSLHCVPSLMSPPHDQAALTL